LLGVVVADTVAAAQVDQLEKGHTVTLTQEVKTDMNGG
jgi:hypothetical protein